MMLSEGIVAEMEKHRWAMEPAALEIFLKTLANPPKVNRPEATGEYSDPFMAPPPKMTITGSTATIPIRGVLMDSVPFMVRYNGVVATGYDEIRVMTQAAVDNKAVKAIVYDFNSPGGMVDGGASAAQAIFNAGQKKRTISLVGGMAASGAYLLASQARKIYAGADSVVGSIGVYTVMIDYSKWVESMGVKVHVVRAGKYKGAGVAGAEITEDQLQEWQGVVDGMAKNLVKNIARGRGVGVEQISSLATGQVWIAAEAKSHGLVDKILTSEEMSKYQGDIFMEEKIFSQVEMESLVAKATQAATQSANEQSQARMNALKAAFPDDLAFAMEQFAKGVSLTDAKAAYCDILMKQKAEKPAASEPAPAPAPAPVAGSQPVAFGGEPAAKDETFMSVATELAGKKSIPMSQALAEVAKSRPELYEKHLDSCEKSKR